MARMGSVVVSVIGRLLAMSEEGEVEEEEMVGWGVVVGQLVEWTDGRRVVDVGGMYGAGEEKRDESGVHVEVAVEVLERMTSGSCSSKFLRSSRWLCWEVWHNGS